MTAKERFLALLDQDIAYFEKGAAEWQLLKDAGNYPDESDAQIGRCRAYAQELRALREKVAAS
jgi:hypothetical protein